MASRSHHPTLPYRTIAVSGLVSIITLIFMAWLMMPASAPAQAQDSNATPTYTPSPTPLPPPPLVELNESNLKQATVFVMQVYDSNTGPIISCVGSGTLVSADGLILTNAHIAVASNSCRADRIVISISLRLNEPPVPTYLAQVLDASQGLDLAVLQIVSFLDGRVVDRNTLQLPFVELGDSNNVNLDDTVMMVGYTDIGSTPVQVERGTINSFTAEARAGNRAWLRTNAPIPGLMSGGGAYDRQGRLIGIPTITPAVIGNDAVDCRSVQDTNGDGQVNADDSCIAIGGFISALRPSRLARGLVRAAALGVTLGPNSIPATPPPPADQTPTFSRLLVSSGVNAAGMPINVLQTLPAGSTSLYLFFDYRNMQNGLIYELRTTVDGRPNPSLGLPSVTWNGGERGMWYIGTAGVPLPNGLYEFTLLIQGRQVANAQVAVGGGPQQLPAFSDITFGLQDNLGAIVGRNYIIPETNIVRAEFNYRNMTPDLTWTQVWYLDTVELARTSLPWAAANQGVNNEPAIQSGTGLASGHYRLELYIGDQLSATSDFVIAGGARGPEADIFTNFQFASGQLGGQPQSINSTFPNTIQNLYVFFDWRQLSQTTPWIWRWKLDNEVLYQVDGQWSGASDGTFYYLSLAGTPSLPDGTYTFEIEMGGIIISSINARVGLGQLPIDAFASAEGITLTGRIIDAESKQGIEGAIFILLLSEFSVEDFLWDQAQVLSISLADADGYFQLPVLLPRGTLDSPILYSMLVRSDSYLPISADGIAVTNETESPLELLIEMKRD